MKTPKKRLPAEERKKIILKCAVKVFAQSNYRAAKMADIAAAAGVSEAMVYKYFPSKKEVFLKILEFMSERIIGFWQEEADKDHDALTTLQKMGMAYFQRVRKHPEELKVQFQAISEIDDSDIAHRLQNDHQKYIGFFESILEKGVLEGSISKEIDIKMQAFLLNGAGIALNMMKLLSLDSEFNESNIEKLLKRYIGSLAL